MAGSIHCYPGCCCPEDRNKHYTEFYKTEPDFTKPFYHFVSRGIRDETRWDAVPLVKKYISLHPHVDIKEKDASGQTAMMYAVRWALPDLVEYIFHLGGDIDEMNNYGPRFMEMPATPLMFAAYWGYTNLSNKLLELGADESIVNERGDTWRKCAEYRFAQIKFKK